MTTNTGHGHVTPRPDGVLARCGGPAFCRVCQQERAALEASKRPQPTSDDKQARLVELVLRMEVCRDQLDLAYLNANLSEAISIAKTLRKTK